MEIRAIALALLLSGCGTTGVVNLAEPEHNTLDVEGFIAYECGTAPAIDKALMLPVVWGDGISDGKTVFILLAKFYENLGINTANWIKGTSQLRAQRDFYRDCIDRSKTLTIPTIGD